MFFVVFLEEWEGSGGNMKDILLNYSTAQSIITATFVWFGVLEVAMTNRWKESTSILADMNSKQGYIEKVWSITVIDS